MRSVVTSAMSTPRYDEVPPSSLQKAHGCAGGSTVQFCAANNGPANNGNTAITVQICLRMVIPSRISNQWPVVSLRVCPYSPLITGSLTYLLRLPDANVSARSVHLQRGTTAIQRT